jgi:hypothetical protein
MPNTPNAFQSAIQAAADAVVAARDFCGDEHAAALDTFCDYGITATEEALTQTYAEANAIWRRSQKAAGVKRKHWRW